MGLQPCRTRRQGATDLTLETLDATAETFDNGGGWGLYLVAALATSYGVTPDDRGGKWVHATISG
ncbi:hypothetical protein GCM10027589_12450 [Actinocorallia lasiicapitis]